MCKKIKVVSCQIYFVKVRVKKFQKNKGGDNPYAQKHVFFPGGSDHRHLFSILMYSMFSYHDRLYNESYKIPITTVK